MLVPEKQDNRKSAYGNLYACRSKKMSKRTPPEIEPACGRDDYNACDLTAAGRDSIALPD
ncbi:hypothetical protein [Algoriphagus sp. 4150]|uniref:hypothetical protein n=1 Tax=Algoriphagus sp. 4150 TaxID=2817756 RepID=UPI00286B783E|nr:hypothetical protein [Algoriphagus sp. 4150]